jgi:hypothetical protein
MSLCKELINYNDKLFYLYRKIKETDIDPKFVGDLKEFWGCSMVIKQIQRQTNMSHYLFIIEIEDVIIS